MLVDVLAAYRALPSIRRFSASSGGIELGAAGVSAATAESPGKSEAAKPAALPNISPRRVSGCSIQEVHIGKYLSLNRFGTIKTLMADQVIRLA